MICVTLIQDEDLWDDTELIRAYDEAVKSYKVRSRWSPRTHSAQKAVSQRGADAECVSMSTSPFADASLRSEEEQPVSKPAPRPPKADQPAAKRAKSAAAPKKSAPAESASASNADTGEAPVAAQYYHPVSVLTWYDLLTGSRDMRSLRGTHSKL